MDFDSTDTGSNPVRTFSVVHQRKDKIFSTVRGLLNASLPEWLRGWT